MSDIDRLEHNTGIFPIGEYPDHCGTCRLADATRRRQEACPHTDGVSEIRLWGYSAPIQRVCPACGATLKEDA